MSLKYCHKCGKQMDDNQKFCHNCGENIFIEEKKKNVKKIFHFNLGKYSLSNIDLATSKKYIKNGVISGVVVLILSLIAWIFVDLDSYRLVDVLILILLIFGVYRKGVISSILLLVYYLLSHIYQIVEDNSNYTFITFLVIIIITNYLYLGVLGAIRFKKLAPIEERHEKSNLVFGIILGVIITVLFAYLLVQDNTSDIVNNDKISNSTGFVNTSIINASVVNVLCPSLDKFGEISDKSSGGSGTIISSDGLIITNSHIIPQDKESINVSQKGCLIVLPHPETGSYNEIYWAEPIVIPDISEEYDLAFLSITEPFENENGEIFGEKSKIFPAINSSACTGETLKLGEEVRILGYPTTSGGESLTITDGIVSSFPGEGLILTSAQIDTGNSGGLAIDRYGCMIGIPSAVNFGEYQNLGVIISKDLILEFINKIPDADESTSEKQYKTPITKINYPPSYIIKYDTSTYSEDVVKIQKKLNTLGYNLDVDGYFGLQTKKAVISFQKENQLEQTGEVDELTWASMFNL